MAARTLWVAVLLAALTVPGSNATPEQAQSGSSELQSALTTLVEGLAQKSGFALQLAWKDGNEEFSIAAGTTPPPFGRPVTVFDTFAFGSGTKPYTAVLILKLAEEGKLSLDDAVEHWVDPLLQAMNSTSLRKLFGEDAKDITVRQLISMQSGLNDFDVPAWDEYLLKEGIARNGPIDFLYGAAAQQPTFLCKPGQCTEYSSTNFVLAGYVALVASSSGMDWTKLDQKVIFAHAAPQFVNSSFRTTGPLSSTLKVPGMSGSRSPNGTIVEHQDASILGWTCGNLVAPASDAARFFYDLLIGQKILKSSTVQSMQEFHPLSTGWAKGYISYGVGLMVQQTSWNASYPPKAGDWGSYIGHGGDTYGFLSEAGVITQLNASFAVVANQDFAGTFVKNEVACNVIEVATRILLKKQVFLKCGLRPIEEDDASPVIV